jgi:glycosyltransferase involved in cell wall biosynthesis
VPSPSKSATAKEASVASGDHPGVEPAQPAAPDREERPPDLSIVVPVNAQGDLDNIQVLLDDLEGYGGPYDVETILVVNNFDDGEKPRALTDLARDGVEILAVPRPPRRTGEAIVLAARMPGIEAARADWVVNLDADCRIRDPTALLNWYVDAFRKGATAAYTRVGHHEVTRRLSVMVVLAIHHLSRWFKRAVLRIPATRGSNYAVRRQLMLDFHERGLLADDMNVGPTFKRLAGPVAYAAGRDVCVLTSGRMFRPGWTWIPPYFLYRLRYNLRVLPVRAEVARFTGRENDPVRVYRNNRAVSVDER